MVLLFLRSWDLGACADPAELLLQKAQRRNATLRLNVLIANLLAL
jgi:hypothetical protein